MKARDLPVTGGIAAVCVFAVLLIKLMTKGDGDRRGYQWQIGLLARGRDALHRALPHRRRRVRSCTGAHLPGIVSAPRVVVEPGPRACRSAYISAALVGIMGIVAAAYNLRQTTVKRPAAAPVPETTR